MNKPIEIPSILTANTFFWKPGGSAAKRRKNEECQQRRVFEFFEEIGMQVQWGFNTVIGSVNGIVATFTYKESCGNVYKHFQVSINGNKSNITSIKKLVKDRNARFEKIEDILCAA